METSRLVPEFIDVDGVETHVLKFGSLQDFSPLQSEQCEKRTMFLVIPGKGNFVRWYLKMICINKNICYYYLYYLLERIYF